MANVPPQQQQQQQPAAPAPLMGKLHGKTLDIFNGDCKKSEVFLQQFNVHWGLNDNYEIMTMPYLWIMYALSLIKGPLVNNWANNQVTELHNKVTHTQNPIGHDREVLWTEFSTAFTAVFTDTARAQNAHMALMHLRMKGSDLDTYIMTFKHLTNQANYQLNDTATIHHFARGLKRGLQTAILYCERLPATFEQWVEATQQEREKHVYRQALMNPQAQKYKWIECPKRNGLRWHLNDESVPMDVDPSEFTQVYHTYTDMDKSHLKEEGQCFNCGNRGHMARDCPREKKPQTKNYTQLKKKSFDKSKTHKGSKKSGPVKPYWAGYQPRTCTASIEEVDSGDEEEEQGEDNISSLSAHTARLSEN
jgi:hypothetical protein